MTRIATRAAIAGALVLACTCLGAAPATPAPPAGQGRYENQPIRSNRPVHVEGAPAPREDVAAPEKQGGKYDFKQVGVGLAVVIAAILALRVAGKRVLSFPGASKLSQSVRVVMRTPVGPRQHLMLVKVGKRLVLVGNTGTQMSALCEITDADEVASLIGQVGAEKSEPATGGMFQSMVSREGEKFDDAGLPRDDEPIHREAVGLGLDPDEGVGREELGDLLERVRGMSKKFGSK